MRFKYYSITRIPYVFGYQMKYIFKNVALHESYCPFNDAMCKEAN